MRIRLRTLAAAAATLAAAIPTSASAAPADVDIHVSPRSGQTVAAECALGPGISTDSRFITYVVQASAVAGGPSPAVATSVRCTVYNASDPSRLYGGASGALPGPYVVAVGQATVPSGVIPAVCVTGGATYLNGYTIASTKTCP